MNHKFVRATFIQLAGIIGAGIFSLPYLFSQSNFYLGVAGLLVLTFVSAAVEYLYIDIILATKGDHQLSGYASIYLNQRAKFLAATSVLLTGLAATIAYTKLGARFLAVVVPTLNPVPAILIFLALAYLFHILRVRYLNIISDYLPLVFIFVPLFLLFIVFLLHLPLATYGSSSPVSLAFFGGTIFALTGFTTLPEVEEALRGHRRKSLLLHLASVLGLIIACLIYLVFSYSAIQISGPFLSSDAVTGIAYVSGSLGIILAVFGFFATFKATVNYLNIFKEVFYRDFSCSPPLAYFLSLLIPLSTLLLQNISFLEIISLAGTVTIFSSVIIICLIRFCLPAKPHHYFLIGLILATFTLGLIFEFFPL